MTHHEHLPYRENIPAYALGALDAEEVAAFEAHLETCASCRVELAEYRRVGESLLMTIPPKQPSAANRKRLQSRLPGANKSPRPQFTFSFGRLALGLSIIALLVLNLFSFLQVRQIQSQQASLLNQVENAQAALAMLSSSNVQMIPIQGGDVSGTVLLNESQNTAVLILQNLPLPARNQVYQIWLVKPDGGRVSAGLFLPEGGRSYTTQTISSTGSFSDYLGIGVTVEPAGGSDAPTGERVFKVDF
jgi:anti-sigma-K factor RskA